MKITLVFILLFLMSGPIIAQNYTVSGKIIGSNNNPLPGAGVQVTGPDSAKYGISTNEYGNFQVKSLSNGTYQIKISFLGFRSYTNNFKILNNPIDLGTITLQEEDKNIKEVEVIGKVPTGIQKGDTTEFNTNAFKTNVDATSEDLVKKLPGISVQDGKVQAHGEDVKKVLVDGKPFFGDDPTASMRNLPAEIIDKVQIFDQLSEQAQFTGFDDGNTQKTLNFITKANARNGKFGKAYAGYGNGNYYEAGGSINYFNGDKRITLIAQSNNINKQNFAIDDLLGAMQGGGRRGGDGGGRRGGGGGGRGGGGMGDFFVNQQQGLATTHALGINYNDKWWNKLEISGSYFINYNKINTLQDITRDYTIQTNRSYSENDTISNQNINQRLNLRLEYQFDSLNILRIRPRVSFQNNEAQNLMYQNNFENTLLTNFVDNYNETNGNGYNFNSEFNYRHRFISKGRSISIDFNPSYNQNNSDGKRDILNSFYSDNASVNTVDNKKSTSLREGWGYSAGAGYTEPIGKFAQVLLQYRVSQNASNSLKDGWLLSQLTQNFDLIDSILTNHFDNSYFSQSTGATLRLSKDKYQASAGLTYQWATQESEQTYIKENKLSMPVNKWQPEFNFQYKPNKTTQFRFTYRANTNFPSISQLQNIIDNTNTMFISIGNPDLNPSVSHNFMLRFSSLSPEKSKSVMVFLNGNIVNNNISNAVYTLPFGSKNLELFNVLMSYPAQLSRPVNVDGYINLRSFITLGIPVSYIKSNLNFNIMANYTQNPAYINDTLNRNKSQVYALGAVLASNISENFDFIISSNANLNFVNNSVLKDQNSEYFSYNTSARLNWTIFSKWVYRTDFTQISYKGYGEGYNQNYMLWNMSFAYKLFKNKAGEIKFSVFDLLKQNRSIDRNVSDIYIQSTRSNVLGQYYMMTFTYNLRAFGMGNKPDQRRDMMGPGGMHMHHD